MHLIELNLWYNLKIVSKSWDKIQKPRCDFGQLKSVNHRTNKLLFFVIIWESNPCISHRILLIPALQLKWSPYISSFLMKYLCRSEHVLGSVCAWIFCFGPMPELHVCLPPTVSCSGAKLNLFLSLSLRLAHFGSDHMTTRLKGQIQWLHAHTVQPCTSENDQRAVGRLWAFDTCMEENETVKMCPSWLSSSFICHCTNWDDHSEAREDRR